MLKPCPFCGGEVRLSTADRGASFAVWCGGCGGTDGGEYLSKESAIKHWNHRSPGGALSRLLSAAREIRGIEREGGGSMDRVDEYRERWEAAIPALCEALEEVEA